MDANTLSIPPGLKWGSRAPTSEAIARAKLLQGDTESGVTLEKLLAWLDSVAPEMQNRNAFAPNQTALSEGRMAAEAIVRNRNVAPNQQALTQGVDAAKAIQVAQQARGGRIPAPPPRGAIAQAAQQARPTPYDYVADEERMARGKAKVTYIPEQEKNEAALLSGRAENEAMKQPQGEQIFGFNKGALARALASGKPWLDRSKVNPIGGLGEGYSAALTEDEAKFEKAQDRRRGELVKQLEARRLDTASKGAIGQAESAQKQAEIGAGMPKVSAAKKAEEREFEMRKLREEIAGKRGIAQIAAGARGVAKPLLPSDEQVREMIDAAKKDWDALNKQNPDAAKKTSLNALLRDRYEQWQRVKAGAFSAAPKINIPQNEDEY